MPHASFEQPGDQLTALAKSSREELFLVAPFVKVAALRRILVPLDERVQLTLITRWRPQEIANGASDLEVFDVMSDRPRSCLRLSNDLHAKYYRSDTAILIGSANISLRAAGWTSGSNIEILDAPTSASARWEAFEVMLLKNSWSPSAEYRKLMEGAAIELANQMGDEYAADSLISEKLEVQDVTQITSQTSFATWTPRTRTPHQLFLAYSGQLEGLTTSIREQAVADLAVLDIPSGLSRPLFIRTAGLLLLQHSLVQLIEASARTAPLRFGELRSICKNWLISRNCSADSTTTAQNILRWVTEFLPSKFELSTPNYSEILTLRN